MTVTPIREPRPANCEVCGRSFLTSDTPPFLCDACEQMAHEGEMAELDAKARAAGFESFDEWADAQYARAKAQGAVP